MPTTKKQEPRKRHMTFTAPDILAHEIESLATELGIHKTKVKEWVADVIFDNVNVRSIVAAKLTATLKITSE